MKPLPKTVWLAVYSFLILTFCSLIMIVFILLYYLQSNDYWIEVEGIVPAFKYYQINKPMLFRSHMQIKHHVVVSFDDRIMCEDIPASNNYSLFSQRANKTIDLDPVEQKVALDWWYDGHFRQLEKDKKCYGIHKAIIHLPFCITKTIVYDGSKDKRFFMVGPKGAP